MPALYFSPIQISPLLHADVMVFPDDDVVETGNANDIACFDQSLGHLDVFPTWGRVPARMEMIMLFYISSVLPNKKESLLII